MKTTADEHRISLGGRFGWPVEDLLDDFASLEAENAKLRKTVERWLEADRLTEWHFEDDGRERSVCRECEADYRKDGGHRNGCALEAEIKEARALLDGGK